MPPTMRDEGPAPLTEINSEGHAERRTLGPAGLLLFPCAALMLLASARPHALLVALVVFGNVAWVVASALVVLLMGPAVLGAVFVLGQAVVVAVLAWVEWQLRGQAR